MMSRQGKSGYFVDARLLPRVQEYVDQNQHKKSIHIQSMVESLRRKYPEYARKKLGPFIASVQKAYQHIQKESPDAANEADVYEALSPSVSGLSDLDEAEPDSKEEEVGRTNSQLRDLYAKGRKGRSDDVVCPGDLDDIMIIDTTPSVVEAVNSPRKTLVAKRTDAGSVKKDIRPGQKRSHRMVESENPQNEKKKEVKTKKSAGFSPITPTATFADIGGNDKTIQEICKLLVHIRHPEVYKEIGVPFPKGILLHGPPGCGKTLFAHAIAGELKLPFFKVAATEVVSGVSGESEEKLRDLFEEALAAAPSILFLDEVDAITPKRETAQREMERRIVAQLLACLDDLNLPDKPSVLVIGATNRPDALDPALRRAGRFDREIAIGIPDEKARIRILKVLCRGLKTDEEFDWLRLARLTPGYVGADLMALSREAAMIAVNRVFEDLEKTILSESTTTVPIDETEPKKNGETSNEMEAESFNLAVSTKENPENSVPVHLLRLLRDDFKIPQEVLQNVKVTFSDFLAAVALVQPSAQREGFATVPGVTWDDVGALRDIRTELQLTILAPVHHPDHFAALGLTTPSGILLCGPPGCGKTLLAKAVANEAGINFISVKGPELLNMYVGESERAVRQCFQRARNSAPCVIFFDEIDALCPKRSDSSESGSSARVVNQLLTEMDGLDTRKNVFILAATNRPDILDPAVLRPGRLDKTLYVGLPEPEDRVEILKALTKNGTKPQLNSDVSLEAIARDQRCERFTGADLSALTREAAIFALREAVLVLDYRGHLQSTSRELSSENLSVAQRHFDLAFQKIKPSVSEKDLQKYKELKKKYSPSSLTSETPSVKMEAE